MPDVAADDGDAELADWLVAENMPFATGDTIATVDTEKAVGRAVTR